VAQGDAAWLFAETGAADVGLRTIEQFEHAPEAAADGIEPVSTRGTRTSSQADIRRPHALGPSSRLSEVLVEYLKQARTKDGDGEPKMMWA
jgi:hypothetical protein